MKFYDQARAISAEVQMTADTNDQATNDNSETIPKPTDGQKMAVSRLLGKIKDRVEKTGWRPYEADPNVKK